MFVRRSASKIEVMNEIVKENFEKVNEKFNSVNERRNRVSASCSSAVVDFEMVDNSDIACPRLLRRK